MTVTIPVVGKIIEDRPELETAFILMAGVVITGMISLAGVLIQGWNAEEREEQKHRRSEQIRKKKEKADAIRRRIVQLEDGIKLVEVDVLAIFESVSKIEGLLKEKAPLSKELYEYVFGYVKEKRVENIRKAGSGPSALLSLKSEKLMQIYTKLGALHIQIGNEYDSLNKKFKAAVNNPDEILVSDLVSKNDIIRLGGMLFEFQKTHGEIMVILNELWAGK